MRGLFGLYALPLLVLSAFGPILGGGVRLEHVAAFGLALLGVMGGKGRSLSPSLVLAAMAWLCLTGVALAETFQAASVQTLPYLHPTSVPTDIDPINLKTVLTGLAQLLLPICAAIVALRADDGRGRTLSLRLIVVLTAGNTIVAGAQFAAPEAVVPLLSLFWPGGDLGTPLLSMGMGRFCGIFNHPAEAAMAVTLALLVLPVAWKPGRERDWAIGLLGPLLVVGGILSFSKTVLFLGFPLVAVCYALEHRRAPIFSRFTTLMLVGWGVFACVGATWVAARLGLSVNSFASLIAITTVGDSGMVGTATGGRFAAGAEGTVAWAFAKVAQDSPLVGLGFGRFLAYDSMYLVAFAYAGLVGLASYLGLLAALAARVRHVEARVPLGITVLFVALAGVGIPTFTAVRVGVLLTVFVCLLVVNPRPTTLRT